MCSAHLFRRASDSATGYSLLAVMEDDSLLYVREGKVVWTREEALASISGALFVDLPPNSAHFGEPEPTGLPPVVFAQRVGRQIAEDGGKSQARGR